MSPRSNVFEFIVVMMLMSNNYDAKIMLFQYTQNEIEIIFNKNVMIYKF